MEGNTITIGAKIAVIGAILIFINTMVVAMNGTPIILSSYQVSSVDQLITVGENATTGFWARIAFGTRKIVSSALMPIWIIFAAMNLFAAIYLLTRPPNPNYAGLTVLVTSLLSVFVGGGFIIGLVLGVLGASIALQWRKPWKETFFVRILRGLRFDSELFISIKNSIEDNMSAALAIIAINFLGMFGAALYAFNVNLILNPSAISPEDPTKILLLGETVFDFGILAVPLVHIGLGIIKWLLIAALFYLFGTKIMGKKVEFDEVTRATAFAYSPRILMLFLPLIFTNEPFLTFQWPAVALWITRIWIFFALVVAARSLFEVSVGRAFGMTLMAASLYWVIIYDILEKELEIPGITFTLEPELAITILISVAMLLGVFLGIFKRE